MGVGVGLGEGDGDGEGGFLGFVMFVCFGLYFLLYITCGKIPNDPWIMNT